MGLTAVLGGMLRLAAKLRQTLEEEKRTDDVLNDLAKQRVNAKAEVM